MKISLQWLSEWVNVSSDVKSLAHSLTMAGLEIEGISSAAPSMSGIVVAEVLETNKHPDAEKLSVCRVSDGKQELQIVCGAPNVRAGIKVPLATVGAVMPNGMEIKKAKLRGVESFGMLCSAKELSLAEESNGLLELPASLITGQNLLDALKLNDTIFEINLTPNRGDCMSVLGVAREVAALNGKALEVPIQMPVVATIQDKFPVRIESSGCRKFVSRVIRGIKPSSAAPDWLRERLRRAGVRSINAVVDVTNYVLLELGQPMHAYDLGKLNGGIVVRQARDQEETTLLDGKPIKLTNDVLVIADEKAAQGMAGVMGGMESAINDSTTDVLLEVAFFEPDAIAGRGRRYGLVTDASQRFERGVDFNLQERAMERATQLILEAAGGSAGPVQITKAESASKARSAITLRHQRLQSVLGQQIAIDKVTAILLSLGMQASPNGSDQWQVTPPSWRFDISIEADVIEEVARIYGYDNIATTPAPMSQRLRPVTEHRISVERVAELLIDRGYQEAITYSFTDPAIQRVLFPDQVGLELANPISSELGVMRLSLWPGLVQALSFNQRRQQTRVRLFEAGRKFSGDGKSETNVLAGIVGGTLSAKQWAEHERDVDFYDVKSDLEALMRATGCFDEFAFERASLAALHPGQATRVLRNGNHVGWVGLLNPRVVKALDLSYPAYVFELEINSSFASQVSEYKEISKFPAVRRDLAFWVDEAVGFDAIKQSVRGAAGDLLQDVYVFDVYHGKDSDKGKKSIALGLNLQDTSRTLTDADVDATTTRVIEHLSQRLNAQLRDK
ncbi:MAG TPA: phenylalanine--tRNA ligase subunit beta [Steroidobacteraceae bacterium]|nr:phenylalanine--tRNA ligase subunit beta [Steroidobacteraceae bacterium]